MCTATKTLLYENIKKINKESPDTGITVLPLKDNIYIWKVIVFGPDNSYWEGGAFRLKIIFTKEYPIIAPIFKFESKMFHPNI